MTVSGEGDSPNNATETELQLNLPESTVANPISAGLFDAAVVTAEIPVTNVVATQSVRPSAVVRQSVPAGPQLLPAPILLRLVVWVLLFLLIVAIIALAVVHYHPSWFSFARNISSSLPQLHAASAFGAPSV